MTFQHRSRLSTGFVVAAAIGLAGAFSGTPATAEVSLEGETLTGIINSKPGGGTDRTARLVGRYLPDYLPGKPDILFKNLPGGGGIKANNYFYSQVEPDGKTFLTGSRTQVSPLKLLRDSVKYNPAEYVYIGAIARLGSLIMINPEEKHRLTDASAKPLPFGGIDGERSGSHAAVWGMEYLDWNLDFVLGYQGTSAMTLAFKRGEVDVYHNQSVFILKPLMDEGFEPVVQLGNPNDDGTKMLARASFPDVPVLGDLLLPQLESKKEMKAYKTWLNDQQIEKWMALPPETPQDIAKAYQAAFLKVMKHPKFAEVAKREFGEDYSWLTVNQLNGIVKEQVNTTREDLEFFIKLREKHGLPVR